jgi:3-isopropylmalate/(R)-2-methylmalate dehydratase large subunit
VTAKDLALHIVSTLGSAGAKGAVIEFMGLAIESLEVEARMTLCNMAAELGAFTAIIAPDEKTIAYLQGRPYAPKEAEWDAAVAYWQTLHSDPDARYDAEAVFDAADVRPMTTWGTSPEQAMPIGSAIPAETADPARQEAQARARAYMGLEAGASLSDLPITGAFIGSCTNSRLSDLRRAAQVLKGRHVAPHVRAICVPGSGGVKAAAEAEGIDRIFRDAGFEWREPGCSMCFFAGGESFGADDRVVSSTNRNFERRQGPGTKTHLASPETVAASAILGRIASLDALDSM